MRCNQGQAIDQLVEVRAMMAAMLKEIERQ